jgi:flagellar protein FlaC
LESLRTVIKVNEEENPDQGSTEKNETEAPITSQQKSLNDSKTDETQNILQNIKDFDVQIMKNQEDIGNLFKKLDGLSNDLDDLVSLYEIVSEQMNPFVGLSKVTKKRIDALENFTQEVESIKTRMNDLESILEKNHFDLGSLKKINISTKSVRTDDTSDLGKEPIDETFSSEIIQELEKNLSDFEVEYIINTSFEVLFTEQNIDNTINEFLLNLK